MPGTTVLPSSGEVAKEEQHEIQELEIEGEPQRSLHLAIFCSRYIPSDFPRSQGGLSFWWWKEPPMKRWESGGLDSSVGSQLPGSP